MTEKTHLISGLLVNLRSPAKVVNKEPISQIRVPGISGVRLRGLVIGTSAFLALARSLFIPKPHVKGNVSVSTRDVLGLLRLVY